MTAVDAATSSGFGSAIMRAVAVATLLVAILGAIALTYWGPRPPDTSGSTLVVVASAPIDVGESFHGKWTLRAIDNAKLMPGMVVSVDRSGWTGNLVSGTKFNPGEPIYHGVAIRGSVERLAPLSEGIDAGRAAAGFPAEAARTLGDEHALRPGDARLDLVFRNPLDPPGQTRRVEKGYALGPGHFGGPERDRLLGMPWIAPEKAMAFICGREEAREIGWAVLAGATARQFSVERRSQAFVEFDRRERGLPINDEFHQEGAAP